jgi:ribose transport system substrate-binding protein
LAGVRDHRFDVDIKIDIVRLNIHEERRTTMRIRALTAVVAAGVVVISTAACGSHNNDSSSGTTTKTRASASGHIHVKHRVIGVADVSSASPTEVRMDDLLKRAAAALGWDVKIVDAAGDPAKFYAAVNAFANEKVDAVIAESFDVAGAKPAVQRLKSAGVPVILIGGGLSPGQEQDFDVSYVEDEARLGKLLGEYMIKDNHGEAKIAELKLSAVPATLYRKQGLDEALREASGGSKILASQEYNLANVVQDANKAVTDMLTSQPSVNAVFANCDCTTAPAVAAVRHQQSNARVYSFYSTPANLGLLRTDSPLRAVVDDNLPLTAAVGIDQLVRHFQKGQPLDPNALDKVDVGYRIIDRNSLPQGAEVFPIDQTLAPFVKQWQAEYGG